MTGRGGVEVLTGLRGGHLMDAPPYMEEETMLAAAPLTTMLPVKDLDRAREFYVNKLGLEAVGLAADGKFLMRAGGTRLALFP